jgi:hypothetical protein
MAVVNDFSVNTMQIYGIFNQPNRNHVQLLTDCLIRNS